MTDRTATAILADVLATYRACSTYEDTGVALEGGAPAIYFETRFVRGTLFDFSYGDFSNAGERHPRAKVTERDGRLSFWTILDVPAPPSLSLCIAALTGVSNGTAHLASSLLLEEVGGWLPTDLTSPERLPDELLFGVPCLHVRGGHPRSPGTWSLFIEETSHLIRKRIAHGRSRDVTEFTTCRAS